MSYKLFLFDVDDTLLDFKASEKLSLARVFSELGILDSDHKIFATYRRESDALWKQLEEGKISKDFLKAERFKRTFAEHKIEADPVRASDFYLESLQDTVVMIEHAEELLRDLSQAGEIGIVTNGIESVQHARLRRSGLDKYIHFVVVSEACGFAKPDVRFFEFTAKLAKRFAFAKEATVVVGDRLETDVLGAHNFGIDACWFNPGGSSVPADGVRAPKHIVSHLSQVRELKR